MNTTSAMTLLSGPWDALSQPDFDAAVERLIDVSGGKHWIQARAHVLRDPGSTPSVWEGVVRFPEANLMPFRKSQYQDQAIFLSMEDIQELVRVSALTLHLEIHQVERFKDVQRIHQELHSWGWFSIGGKHFVLTFPKALEEEDGFLDRLEGLEGLLGIRRPGPGDSDRGLYWTFLYDELND